MVNPFIPEYLVGRETELQQVSQILANDGDLMIAGIPGNGRRSLIRWAAQHVGARVLELDCLRAISSSRFLELLAEGLTEVFSTPAELGLIQHQTTNHPIVLELSPSRQPRLVWHASGQEEWLVLDALLTLLQVIAEVLECRVVLMLRNFPHIRSWDRSGQWEDYLRQEVKRQSRVSYVLIATVPEIWADDSQLQVITLPPLYRSDLQTWILEVMASQGLQFEADSQALELFLNYIQGHLGEAVSLAHRIWLDSRTTGLIQADHVHRNALALVEDLSLTFESMLLLLPPIQARVLECLALDPTDSPHARDYIQKHQLSRGGGLQGALSGLEQKGLIYGPKYGYCVSMPLLAFWLKHRIA
jgi:hypothetical protein